MPFFDTDLEIAHHPARKLVDVNDFVKKTTKLCELQNSGMEQARRQLAIHNGSAWISHKIFIHGDYQLLHGKFVYFMAKN
jgi:hypothetical protein